MEVWPLGKVTVVSDVWVVMTEGVREVEVDMTASLLVGSFSREEDDEDKDDDDDADGRGDGGGSDEEGGEVEDVRTAVLDGDLQARKSV